MKTPMIVALAVASLSFTPATAETGDAEITQAVIRHADLDLSRAGDVRKFDQRIRAAVRKLCGNASDLEVAGKNEVGGCRSAIRLGVSDKRRDLILAARRSNGSTFTAR